MSTTQQTADKREWLKEQWLFNYLRLGYGPVLQLSSAQLSLSTSALSSTVGVTIQGSAVLYTFVILRPCHHLLLFCLQTPCCSLVC